MLNSLDKIDRWLTSRHSNFTASLIFKLRGTGKDGKGFSSGAWTYIEEKAIETMTVLSERPELEEVESLRHGKFYEEPAFHRYVEVSRNYNMKHFGGENPVYLPYNKYSGGSPDALMGEGEKVYWGAEIKCPSNSKNHYKYLKFKDQFDLRESRIEYYSQIQFLLMITQAEGFHFVSYDERFRNPKLQIKIIEVLPDKSFQDNLDIRIQLAQKEKVKIIKNIEQDYHF